MYTFFKNTFAKFVIAIMIAGGSVISPAEAKKTILMIEVMESASLVEKAKELDYDVVIFTANKDQRIVKPEILKLADSHVVVDTSNLAEVVAAAMKFNKTTKIDAVLPGNEFFVIPSATIAKKLRLRSITVESATKARNKDYTLIAMQKKGVPVPRFKVVKNPEQIAKHAAYIKFPAILKPVDSAASDKVFKVNSVKEAQEKLREITQPSDAFEMWNYPLRNTALFEEFVPGQEYSVEGFVVDNKTTIYSITTRQSLGNMEAQDTVGPIADERLKKNIEDYVYATTKALGVNYSPFHMELRLNKAGAPLIMEIGVRIAGGSVPKLIDFAKDTNFAEDYFGILTDPNYNLKAPTFKRIASVKFFYNPKLTYLKTFDGIDKLRRKSWVKEVKQNFKAGDSLPSGPLFLKTLGHVIFLGDSWEDIHAKAKMIDEIVTYN